MNNELSKAVTVNSEIEINGAKYIVERSFGTRKTITDLLAQRVITEKRKNDEAKQTDINEIA